MYRLHDLKRRTVRDIADEAGLLAAGFDAEEIVTMLCGLPVRRCLVEAVSEVRLVDPFTLAEISDITGIAMPTVSGIVQRALRRMSKRGLHEFLTEIRAARNRQRSDVEISIEWRE